MKGLRVPRLSCFGRSFLLRWPPRFFQDWRSVHNFSDSSFYQTTPAATHFPNLSFFVPYESCAFSPRCGGVPDPVFRAASPTSTASPQSLTFPFLIRRVFAVCFRDCRGSPNSLPQIFLDSPPSMVQIAFRHLVPRLRIFEKQVRRFNEKLFRPCRVLLS